MVPGLALNDELLAPGIRAPVPLAGNSRQLLQEAFRSVLTRGGALADLVEPAASTGGGMVHACQELVLGANRLLAAPREGLTEAVRKIIWACRDLQGATDAAYVLQQAAETVPGAAGKKPGTFERGKNLIDPLERRLGSFGLPVHMDPSRFGILLFQLDEAYDIAVLELQRFYDSLRAPEPLSAFAAQARALAPAIARELVPDQVLGIGAGKDRERTGLFDLLPEMERDLEVNS